MPARKQTYDSPRQLARRASILEATRELLSKHGYEGTTIRDVAEQAGVAKGTLYNIYGGKDELIFSAVIDVRDDIGQRTLELDPTPGLDTILKVNQAIIEEIVRTPTYTEAISRALFGAPAAKMLIRSLIATPIEVTRKDLDVAKDLGQLDQDVDSRVLARQLEMQRWGLILAVSVGQISIDELKREVAHGMVRILRSVVLPSGQPILDAYLRDSV
jgi:AcrR family transcriptional regulator